MTLEDTGVRDEHGLEPIPSFSSPQKLDAGVEDGIQQMASYTADGSMDMAHSEQKTAALLQAYHTDGFRP